MPDFLRDYHLWWLDFWSDDPVSFLVAAIGAIIFVVWIKSRKL